jgi:hypothetical protein
MDIKPCLRRHLAKVRQISEAYLAAFHTPEQWTLQVHPEANHPLWFAGHIGMVDNFMIGRLSPEKAASVEAYAKLFGMGSRPSASAAEYPPPEEVVAFMRERRQTLLGIFDSLTEDDMARPTPAGTPDFMPDFASVFEAAAWHEALHAGQVSVARRSLGLPPLADAPRSSK